MTIQHPPHEESLAHIAEAIDAAQGEMPIVAVQHGSPRDALVFAAGSTGWRLHPDVEGRSDPLWKHVEKQHASVFTETGLAEWLHEQGVSTITLVGYMTNNCILATASDAERFGLAVEVLSDATRAVHLSNEAGTVAAQQLHETLMVLLQSNFAAVATTKQWLAALTRKQALPKSNLVTSALQGADAFM